MTNINQSVYPGKYDPGMVKSLLEDNIKGVVIYPDKYAVSARDMVIGSVHAAFGMKPVDPFVTRIETIMENSGVKKRFTLADAIDSDDSKLLKELYSHCVADESKGASAHIVMLFDVPRNIMKTTKITPGHLFRYLKVEDTDQINQQLSKMHELAMENFVELGMDDVDSETIVMYWAPWSEVSSAFAN